ncbi:hypothetical protein [Nocardia wallacei]|uniref:hypothetical protein n=1 Tax=Nocardia wallacei TaxID=480035 RepID=UPI002456DF2B|nr:hypothetical protein [Nocardia wallacei]
MQVLQIPGTEVLRPARLNYAGWCIYCGERNCINPWCVKTHERSVWGPCSVCGGSQQLGMESGELCGICIGGLTEYDSQAEADRRAREMAAVEQAARHLSTVLDADNETTEYVVADRPDVRVIRGGTELLGWHDPAPESVTVAPPSVRSASGHVYYAGF